MKAEFEARKGRAGAPRRYQHIPAGRRQVAESLRRQGLRAKAARTFKATTHSNHALPVAENLLQPDFTAERPHPVGVGDITSIGTDEGWLYLVVVLDRLSRKGVGAMSERRTAARMCAALRMAGFARKQPPGGVVHPERGSQYCSREHRALLAAHGWWRA